jgi:hypothetical protein
MRILTSIMLAAIVLTLPLSVIAAPSQQATIDIKSLALTKADLQWRGFEMVPDRTVSEDRTDGVAVYDVTFARERTNENLASGPFEVRSGVARTAAVDDAVLQLDSTKEAFIGEGWTQTGVPPLGDDALGLTQTTDWEGGKIAHFSYLFRKGSYILMIGVRGRPDVTKIQDAVGLAIIVSGRLDKAIGSGAAPSTGAAPSSGAPGSSGSTTRQGTGEKVRVLNAEGGSVNMRAEPSTSADVVVQISEGTTLDIVGPNRDADGRTWRNVQSADRKNGWIASSFLETIAAPPAAPSPSPVPPRAAATSTPAPDTSQPAATDGETADPSTDASADASPSPSPSPSPSASATAQTAPAASAGGNTFKGSGNGIDVEMTIRDLNLSSGKQQVKVKATRGGGGVADAFVNMTARLDPKRFRAIKADNTNQDGYTEVEFDMDGPPGSYEVLVEVRTAENGPATSAKGTFRWK